MPEAQHVAAEVISASIGGMVSASALYPLEVIKTKMQAGDQPQPKSNDDKDDDDNQEERTEGKMKAPPVVPTSSLDLAKQMYEEDGIQAFYKGVGTSAFQSATEKALYFFAYTSFKNMYTAIVSSKDIGTLSNLST